jgi:hypothetical protein
MNNLYLSVLASLLLFQVAPAVTSQSSVQVSNVYSHRAAKNKYPRRKKAAPKKPVDSVTPADTPVKEDEKKDENAIEETEKK